MKRIHSFPPIATSNAKILILGSMPGVASLSADQYYAHPQNSFWKIVGEILGFDPTAEYTTRVSEVAKAGIAVWDVLESCHRVGSGDSEIDRETICDNDFEGLFQSCPLICSVFFNGAMAENCYRKYVLPHQRLPALRYFKLPSTSPAYASMTFANKLAQWRVIAVYLQ